MPRNGTGTYTLPQAPFIPGTTISSSAVNSDFSDIATAITGSLPRDGQAGMIGQLKLPDGASNVPSLAFINDLDTGFSRAGEGVIAVDIDGVTIGTFTAAGWTGAIGTGAVPYGLVMGCPMGAVPAKWLLCDGSLISRTTYANLFAAIGATWSAGDGVTTFGVPDFRGRSLFGIDPGTGRLYSPYFSGTASTFSYGGLCYHSMTTSELISHYHSASIYDPQHQHYVMPTYGGTAAGSPGLAGIGFSGATDTSLDSTGVQITSSNGLTTTYSQGGSTPFSIVPPSATIYWIIYAGA